MFAISLVAKNFIWYCVAENSLPTPKCQVYQFRCGRRKCIPLTAPNLAALGFRNDPPVSNRIRSTAGITCSKVLSGCPAEEPEHSSLTQSMRFDRQVDEQSLKSWVCRFNSSRSVSTRTHESAHEYS